MTLKIDPLPPLLLSLLLPGMKLRNPSRSPGFFLAQIPIAEKFGVGDQALEKPIGQPLGNPDELLQ